MISGLNTKKLLLLLSSCTEDNSKLREIVKENIKKLEAYKYIEEKEKYNYLTEKSKILKVKLDTFSLDNRDIGLLYDAELELKALMEEFLLMLTVSNNIIDKLRNQGGKISVDEFQIIKSTELGEIDQLIIEKANSNLAIYLGYCDNLNFIRDLKKPQNDTTKQYIEHYNTIESLVHTTEIKNYTNINNSNIEAIYKSQIIISIEDFMVSDRLLINPEPKVPVEENIERLIGKNKLYCINTEECMRIFLKTMESRARRKKCVFCGGSLGFLEKNTYATCKGHRKWESLI